MSAKEFIDDIARAIAFLSRLPVSPSFFEGYSGNISETARVFPLAGAVIAMPSALLMGVLLAFNVHPLMASLLALISFIVITGALHEDGLADTIDGLGGGKDKAHTLLIMKDSRIGAYGALGLIASFALRASALFIVAEYLPPLSAALTLPAASAISRGAMVWHWQTLPAAKIDGVAASAGQPDFYAMRFAVTLAVALAVLLLWPNFHLLQILFCLIFAGIIAFAITERIRSRIDGHTGDTIGAVCQLCEVAALCALAICV